MATILVVDDERDVVLLIKFLLKKDGHQVVEAFNGAEALQILGLEPPTEVANLPDLIILDVMMPVVDGLTVCRKAADHPKVRGIPMIILTARGKIPELSTTAPNVASQLEKPFDPQKLRELVRGILGS
ncbi:MAG: hypothetical protein A2X36_15955 [Elusimicrobia bacterium GWA2_69_24]|nr:MAG: hypothetical protein A2X36_15955 [Elusimicrobia bacterium GWA2_69_24]HBL16598.1 hypothetical protein [Elusimicrobiota bacterium]